MKKGDTLRVMKKGNETQSYIPGGMTCEYVKELQEYIAVRYEGREYLMSKKVLEATNETR